MSPGSNLAPKGRHAMETLDDDTDELSTLPDGSGPSRTSLHPLQVDRRRALEGAPLEADSGTVGLVRDYGALELSEEGRG
eukprot:674175-Pyramimonas_sp.AAC.1